VLPPPAIAVSEKSLPNVRLLPNFGWEPGARRIVFNHQPQESPMILMSPLVKNKRTLGPFCFFVFISICLNHEGTGTPYWRLRKKL